MLIPLSETCRQLRRIALSHMSLWKTISPSRRYYDLPSILLQKSHDTPLIAILNRPSSSKDDVLGNLNEADVQRMQELHIFELYIHHLPDDMATKIDRFFRSGSGLPLLESLSLSQVFTRETDEWHTNEDECPFSLDDAPRLRHMMLHDVTFVPRNAFPHLTHLSLSGIYTPHCHTDTAALLSRCPNLESLDICCTNLEDTPLNLPAGCLPLSLNRLRRVTLYLPQFCDPVTDFYLSLFPLDDPALQPAAFQILEVSAMDNVPALGQMLRRVTKAEASHLSLALNAYPIYKTHQLFSISAAGPRGTFHISTESFRSVKCDPREVLNVSARPFLDALLCGGTHLRAVREVWVTSADPRTEERLYRDATECFQSTIAALPALETVVLVVAVVGADLEVDLGVLPSAHDPGFASANLKTLRIVHGSNSHAGEESVEKVRLTKLLDQVGTGAYGYFENVMMQMTRPLEVDEEDLARLEARFRKVTFQRIHSMPTMPLPEYCTEPYAGPGGSSTWNGSLW